MSKDWKMFRIAETQEWGECVVQGVADYIAICKYLLPLPTDIRLGHVHCSYHAL